MGGTGWTVSEELLLKQHYNTLTIKELMKLFSYRTQDSINAKIKRMVANGELNLGKEEGTVKRALKQRSSY